MVSQWPIPGGGSPDMGNISADGRWLWLAGRFDDVVYRIDTSSGDMRKIKVGMEPHGLVVWPCPDATPWGTQAICAESWSHCRCGWAG